ncbi:hypothetical protein JTB14_035857 [Gonioctena quinquepunctata]|nr:hypothetical protein JTB14_035857 [Gonioctena quinquepunctata]
MDQADNLSFKTFCRMSPSDFDTILNLVVPKIAKKDTTFRKSIPMAQRLAIILRYLVFGDSFTSLSFLFSFLADNFKLVHSIVDKHEQSTESEPVSVHMAYAT